MLEEPSPSPMTATAPVELGCSCMTAELRAVPFAECFAHSCLQSIINTCNVNNFYWNVL